MIFNEVKMTPEQFDKFRKIIYDQVGINLLPHKIIMLQGRIRKRLKKLEMESFDDYYDLVLKNKEELLEMFNVVSTNKTEFFRESHHFDFFEEIIPKIIEKNKKKSENKLSVWCAASSTGEEPYTISMILNKHLALKSWRVKVIASDISTTVLKKAEEGIYKEADILKVPLDYRKKNFLHMEEDLYRVSNDLKNLVKFKRINLKSERYPFSGEFEIIFCRNVMIYFDRKTQIEIIYKFLNYLKKGGYLILGSSESLPGELLQKNLFKRIKSTIYQKL